jgi:outer membrane receptor protein involved in Fe transport
MRYIQFFLNLYTSKQVYILLFLLIGFSVFAQKPNQRDVKGEGVLTGKITDSISGNVVEYATISLIQQADGKVINGATTNDKGFFKLTEIPNGTYNLLIYFIGYKTSKKENIIITPSSSQINLGNLTITNRQTSLKEVAIVAEQNLIEYKIDKMVYNADKDLTSQGGVALDILKKVPQVSVDVNGNVELQGSSGIRFLINRKPSTIFGNNIADVLQTIPASQIQSIEVVTSPGAKYDAEGTGGIINIILKKNDVQGINGNVSLSAGTRLENGSLNLNARKNKFGVNTFVSGNAQLLSTTINTMNRTTQSSRSLQSSQLLQDGTSDFTRQGYQAGLNFDWDINDKNNMNGSFSYNNMSTNNIGITNRQSILNDSVGNTYSNIQNAIDATNTGKSGSYDWSLSYKKKFNKKDQELEVLYSSSISNNYSYYNQTQKYVTPDSVFNGSYGNNPGISKETNIAINYVQPIGENVVFETGAKAVFDNIDSKSDVYLLNVANDNYSYNNNQSSALTYKRSVYAYYASIKFQLLKFLDVKIGCRDEYTQAQATYLNVGSVNINPYNMIVPSGVISHKFKNNQLLKLSYSYRISRPDFRDLNPFINAADPKNITTGNPNLKPETTHNIELGYNKTFKKSINIGVALFYRGNNYDIQSYTRYYSSYQIGDSVYHNVAVSTRENIGKEDNFGLNVNASIPIKSKITFRTNLAAFQRYIYNSIDPGKNIEGFNYRINASALFQISKTLFVEVAGNFNSARLIVQGRMPSMTTYNFALRKRFFHDKASFAFTATNPFNKYIDQKTTLSGVDFTSYSLRQLPYRSFGINLTYKFGRLEFKKERAPEDINLNPPGMGGN